MLARRLSRLAVFVLLPATGAAVACGSSSNPASPGDGGVDSGIVADVGTQDTGVADTGLATTDATADGGAGEAASDGACPPPPTGAFTQAPHAPLPTVAYQGGPVLTAPAIVAFTFPTTSNVAALQAFTSTITQTSWFADVTKDYCIPDGGACISAGPAGVPVPLTITPDAVYIDTFGTGTATGGTDLEAFINQQIAAAVTASTIPAPTDDSLYIFFFPSTTTIWIGAVNTGQESCSAFGGYHNGMMYTDGTTHIRYAILPDCEPGSTRDLESVEVATSHEVVEATTDPDPTLGPLTWYLDVPENGSTLTTNQERNDPWTNLQFGEIGDNCESVSNHTWPLDDAGTTVQRIWSISAAAVSHNPCIPVPAGETYYNASPDKAIYVANVGQSFTVDVSAFTDVARPAWTLEAFDDTPTQMTMSGSSTPLQYLQVEFVGGSTSSDGTSLLSCVNNGTTAQLKVTLLADPDNDSTLGSAANQDWPEAVGLLYSVDTANPKTRTGRDGGLVTTYPFQFWPFSVVTPATATANGIPSGGVQEAHQLRALHAAHRSVQRQAHLPAPPLVLVP